jgi:hypothetical protein
LHCGADGALVEQLAERRLVHHVRELVRREHVAEVDQRARHRGDRDPFAACHVARVQAPAPVHPNAARPAVTRRHEHLDARDSAAPELQMHCGSEAGKA